MRVGDGKHLNIFVCKAKENREFDCPVSALEDDIIMNFYTWSVELETYHWSYPYVQLRKSKDQST